MESSSQFQEIQIRLPEPIHGLDHVRGVLGLPEWWPTGERVAIVFAHGGGSDLDDPLIVALCRALTARSYLTLRFNFPFAEAEMRSSADSHLVLERSFRAALNVLGRDPSALPARLFLGGIGIGARAAASLVADPVRADGLFLLGFPLHPQDKPAQADPEVLFRTTSPMLFIQGDRDRRCDGTALRKALRRVGAPMELYDVPEADANFRVARRSTRTNEQVQAEVFSVLANWITRRLRS
jgi:predicted alpha/beta-hydrolase family hydrolase